MVTLMSKSWYHWQYLRETDHSLRSYQSAVDFSKKMDESHSFGLGGLGMNSTKRAQYGSSLMGYTISPFFSKNKAFKHTALADHYAKVIYWHLAIFYLTVGILISLFLWG